MAVRAKFRVGKKIEFLGGSKVVDGKYEACTTHTIYLSPVSGGSAEDKAFHTATPSGNIELVTVNEQAAADLILGESYYVSFEKAPSE